MASCYIAPKFSLSLTLIIIIPADFASLGGIFEDIGHPRHTKLKYPTWHFSLKVSHTILEVSSQIVKASSSDVGLL